ncbi:N5-glutamine methyltransferase family protein [Hydrogenimonas sp.]
MTIEEALKEASRMLARKVDRPRYEAELLLAHHLGCERIRLHAHGDESVNETSSFFTLVERRRQGMPVEYITGRVSFYDIELEVGPGVLIARPETELLVDEAAVLIAAGGVETVAEIGIGSGAVSIVLARKFPHLKIVATDISPEALGYAARNIARYGLQERIFPRRCNLLEGVEESVDLLVSNPPYIAESYELPTPLHYEPKGALVGGRRGDEVLKEILVTVKEREIPRVVCEMGYDQRVPIERYCETVGLPVPRFYRDLAGHDRGFSIVDTK